MEITLDVPNRYLLNVDSADKVADIDLSDLMLYFGELDCGEIEAMALFKKLHADVVLLDEWAD